MSGIADIDEICYGDSSFVVGLTNMALLAMKTDTKYVECWLDEMGASEEERNVVALYTLLFCVDFMSEQGMKFDNGKSIPVDKKTIEIFDNVFGQLYSEL